MNEENEDFYNSDDDYEDLQSDDEVYDLGKYYLTDQQLDDLIHQIQQNGSKHSFYEIEAFLCSTDETEVYEWRQDLNIKYNRTPTFNQIEKQLDKKFGKPQTRTPPIHHETTEIPTSPHEIETGAQINDTVVQKQIIKNSTIFPGELKALVTKAAFQHWKIATHTAIIQDNIKIINYFKLSPNAAIFIPNNSTIVSTTTVNMNF